MRKYHHVGFFLKLEYGPGVPLLNFEGVLGPGVVVPTFHHAETKVPNSLPQKGTKNLLVLIEMKMKTFFLLGGGGEGLGGGRGEGGRGGIEL